MTASTVHVRIEVNGVQHEALVEPRRTLADFVREDCSLTGTHLGCEQGLCGSCTLLVDGESVRGCLMFAVQANGRSVTSVEGLTGDGELGPVQEAFREGHGLQCGFCTPGMLLTTEELLAEDPQPDDDTIRDALSGNLCRCTGYRDILASVHLAAAKKAAAGGTVVPEPATEGALS